MVQEDIMVEEKRHQINHFGRHITSALPQGHTLSHDIDYQTPGFFCQDGIHLSEVSLETYPDASRDKILSLI